MHSKRECNYLPATHEAAVAVAVAHSHYGNNVSSCDCYYCGCNCNMDRAAATATTTMTATTATASTPTLCSNTSNTIMADVNGQYAHGMRWGQCSVWLHAIYTAAATAPHSPQSRCKLQAANGKLPTANCKLQAVLLWQHAPR